MKKIIFRKISIDCLKFFLLSLGSISVIIWVLQAVNYLDYVVEDGHGFVVYLKYTLLSFPKIISRIFPFMVFFSTIYILLKYENNNELVIFWNFGISKLKFINFFIKLSFLFLIFNLLLNSIIVPQAQDKAKTYIRTSELDFFESMLKPKKFIDIVENLTIYFENKTPDGHLNNIFIKDNSKENGFQVTIAKRGKFLSRGNQKLLVLYDGKTLNSQNESIAEFKFTKSDFNMARYGSSNAYVIKTQEHSTSDLLKCAFKLQEIKKIEKDGSKIFDFNNCRINNLKNIYQELYRRLIIPFFNPLLIMIPLLIILKSKNDSSFNSYKFKIFALGFFFIIFLEASRGLVSFDMKTNFFMIVLPIFFYFLAYLYFYKNLELKK
jgi:lipopolysaccharide export system permease protein